MDTKGNSRQSTYPTMLQKFTSCKWQLCYMLTLALTLALVSQTCMGFALVCIREDVNETLHGLANISTFNSKVLREEVSFSSEEEGILISSVYYAAVISPMLGTYLSRRFGPKRTLFIGMALGGSSMILIPVSLRAHLYIAVGLRVLLGLTTNCVLPVSYDFWVHWAPTQEKEQLIGCVHSAFGFSGVLLYASAGFLCQIQVDNGWPFIFYVFGGCVLFWCLIWWLVVFDSPRVHPRIKTNERMYIEASRPKIEESQKSPIPWRSLVFSRGVLVYILMMFDHSWIVAVTANYFPLYLATVSKFPVYQIGLVMCFASLARALNVYFWTLVSKYLQRVMSLAWTRKCVQSIGYVLCFAFTFSLAYLTEGQGIVSAVLVIISIGLQTVVAAAAFLTPIDIAPRYASIIASAGSAAMPVASSIAPLVVSQIISQRTQDQWRIVFFTNAGLYIFSAIVFLICGSSETEPWGQGKRQTSSDTQNCNSNPGYVSDENVVTHM